MMMEFPVCIFRGNARAHRRPKVGCPSANSNERKPMALEMRANCEKCGGILEPTSEAYICRFECTFCPACTHDMKAVCPNCAGELVRRPREGKVTTTP